MTESGAGIFMVVRPNTTILGFRIDQINLMNLPVLAGEVVNGERIQAYIHVPQVALGNCNLLFDKYS